MKKNHKSCNIQLKHYLERNVVLNGNNRKLRTKINTLGLHLIKLGKEQIKHQVDRRKEILKTIADINKIDNSKKLNKT